MRRRTKPPAEERGVYVDRVQGIVRSVTSRGADLSVRFANNGDVDAHAADLWIELDTIDPIQHDGLLPAPRHLRLI